jgi:hypothetical protein
VICSPFRRLDCRRERTSPASASHGATPTTPALRLAPGAVPVTAVTSSLQQLELEAPRPASGTQAGSSPLVAPHTASWNRASSRACLPGALALPAPLARPGRDSESAPADSDSESAESLYPSRTRVVASGIPAAVAASLYSPTWRPSLRGPGRGGGGVQRSPGPREEGGGRRGPRGEQPGAPERGKYIATTVTEPPPPRRGLRGEQPGAPTQPTAR